MAATANSEEARQPDAPNGKKKIATMINDPTTCVTQRQLELIALFASGYDYAAIASAKFVSHSAVRATLARAKANVGADSLTHLCTLCHSYGLLVRDGDGFKPVVDPTDAT